MGSTPPRGRAIDGVINDLALVFKGKEPGGDAVHILVERPGSRPEVLKVFAGQDSLASLKHPVAWKTGRVEPAAAKSWAELFGPAKTPDEPAAAIIVHFGQRPNRPPSALGITEQPGLSERLAAVVKKWLLTRPAVPSPWLDGVAALNAEIKRQLDPADVKFYYERNAGKIKAAELEYPPKRRNAG
jgi:hypothetical protein